MASKTSTPQVTVKEEEAESVTETHPMHLFSFIPNLTFSHADQEPQMIKSESSNDASECVESPGIILGGEGINGSGKGTIFGEHCYSRRDFYSDTTTTAPSVPTIDESDPDYFPDFSLVCETEFKEGVEVRFVHGRKVAKAIKDVGLRKRQNICRFCREHFCSTHSLRRHIRIHTGERPYSCTTCKQTFAQESSLKRHYRCHTGERPYICPTCDKGFTASGNLDTHMRIHANIRVYKCTTCLKKFIRKSSLDSHTLTHTGERPYTCEECGSSFAQHFTYKCHKRTHTGEKPYKCATCEKTFSQGSSLRRHLKNIHDQKSNKV